MSSEEEEKKNRGVAVDHHHQRRHDQHQHLYGTFQGVANFPSAPPLQQSPPPVIGFPQPVPPPVVHDSSASYYVHGYQTVPVHVVAEGRPVRQRRLPCCGIGLGWFLFIIGFFLGSIPWYVGLLVLTCGRRIDYREKPGYIACTIAAILATIAIILGASKGVEGW